MRTAIFILALLAFFGHTRDADAADKPAIRLPSITHRWKAPGEVDAPSISFEELDRCIGTDVEIRARIEQLKTRRRDLEREQVELEALSTELTTRSQSLASENDAVGKMATDIDSRSAALEQRKLEIERLLALPNQSAANSRLLNGMIADYNRDATANNARRSEFAGPYKALQTKYASFNAELDTFNRRATDFDARNTAFNIAANRFNDEVRQHASRCEGDRELVK